MKPIAYDEYEIVDDFDGIACILVHDGDYDRAVVWPLIGLSCECGEYDRLTAKDDLTL